MKFSTRIYLSVEIEFSKHILLDWNGRENFYVFYYPAADLIVYYVPRRIMRVITRRATMLAGDRSRDKAETKPRRDLSCEHFKRVS